MQKLSVGDVAIIKQDLEVGMDYGEVSFREDMLEWLNELVMVTEVIEDSDGKQIGYRVLQNEYTWSPSMLELLSRPIDIEPSCGT